MCSWPSSFVEPYGRCAVSRLYKGVLISATTDQFVYRVHGLVVSSPVALPTAVLGQAEPADVAYRVALKDWSAARVGDGALHSRPDNLDDPWVIEHWILDTLVVEFPGAAAFEVSTTTITLVHDEANDPSLVAHLVLDHVLPRVIALRGDLMLHAAGAVGPSGRAHVFIGTTGAGKSTLATALAARGWPLLDDDGVRVIFVDGVPCAVPGYAGVRLLPDSARAVLPGVAPGAPMSLGNDKRRFAVDGAAMRMASGVTPIGGVYVLGRTSGQPVIAYRLGFGQSVREIEQHAFRLAAKPADIARRSFGLLADVASGVAVWRLETPSGLEQIASTVAFLEKLDVAK